MAKIAKSAKKFVKKHLKHTITRRRKLRPMKKALRRESKEKQGAKCIKVGEPFIKNVPDMDVEEFLHEDFWDAEINDKDVSEEEEQCGIEDSLLTKDEGDNFVDIMPLELLDDKSEDEDEDEDEEDKSGLRSQNKSLRSEVEKHKKQLERLQQKDPEFFQFLKEHDKELLEFSDDGDDDDDDDEKVFKSLEGGWNEHSEPGKDMQSEEVVENLGASTLSLSTALVDVWCQAIKEKQHMGALHNLLRAFRTACHYGDGEDDNLSSKYNISSSHVFNRIMVFTLCEIDGVFRKYLQIDSKSEKSIKDMAISDLQKLPRWKKLEPLFKSYFGNALHILHQMTDNQMIAFTLRRLKASIFLLGAFPKFARKYLKVALHFWGRGEGALPLVSFLFVRDMVLWLGTEYLELCLKGIYKEYAANSKFINVSVLPHVHFMANCVVELNGVDLIASYQHAFVFIRQLAIILRNALTMKTKESFKNVYSWQYTSCLELWVKVLCTYASKNDLQPLVYPMSQIIGGVARLLPATRYFPLRLRCAKMLSKLAAGTGTFIPVAPLLLDMLQFKELRGTPTGGVGKAIDFGTILKVTKPTLKTRGFQDECVAAVIEQLVEHLVQWSYAIAFPELVLIPLLGLRSFLKETKVDRFRRQVKQLVDVIERNIEYVGRKRDDVNFSPKDVSSVSTFLQAEKQAGSSPLSQYAVTLRQRVEQRRASLHISSMIVVDQDQNMLEENLLINQQKKGEDITEEGVKAFGSDWLPPRNSKGNNTSSKATEAPGATQADIEDETEDVLVDLEFSSDDEHVHGEEAGNGPFPARKRKKFEGVTSYKKKRPHGERMKSIVQNESNHKETLHKPSRKEYRKRRKPSTKPSDNRK